MARTYGYSANFDREVELLFREAVLLGEGHNGIVYKLPGNKAIKIFQDKKTCKEEAKILLKVKRSKYFPKIYKYDDLYIIREMVDGMRLDHYIEKYGLSQRLTMNLYKLIKEFEELNFSKLDARCRDIYVEGAEKLRVIDPKQCYSRKVNFPRHLMKGLDSINVLDQFYYYLRNVDKKTAAEWDKKMKQYYYNKELENDVDM